MASSSMSLKWCKKNLDLYSQRVYDLLKEEYPEVQMEVVECADVCAICSDVPFVLRNNAVIAAKDARGLYRKLKKGMSFLEKPALPGTYADVVAHASPQPDEAEKEPAK
ncbi:DUF1450 domain-containing protein [Alicyclobacillaceae bacterium I2511]|nr:DUF1450 domain-containing protein [Alicyclobacillaceae bacterium I2511]